MQSERCRRNRLNRYELFLRFCLIGKKRENNRYNSDNLRDEEKTVIGNFIKKFRDIQGRMLRRPKEFEFIITDIN